MDSSIHWLSTSPQRPGRPCSMQSSHCEQIVCVKIVPNVECSLARPFMKMSRIKTWFGQIWSQNSIKTVSITSAAPIAPLKDWFKCFDWLRMSGILVAPQSVLNYFEIPRKCWNLATNYSLCTDSSVCCGFYKSILCLLKLFFIENSGTARNNMLSSKTNRPIRIQSQEKEGEKKNRRNAEKWPQPLFS